MGLQVFCGLHSDGALALTNSSCDISSRMREGGGEGGEGEEG